MELQNSYWLKTLSLALLMATVVKASSPDATCRTTECLALEKKMTQMMNLSANPCNDFHNFACGNFANTVKYNRAKAHVGHAFGQVLFEDSLSVIEETLVKNLYELLITNDTEDTGDDDMNKLYSFAKLLFRSCGEWMQQDQMADDPFNNASYVEFFKGVYSQLQSWLRSSVQFESVLAALTKSGGRGMMKVDVAKIVGNDYSSKDAFAREEEKVWIILEHRFQYKCPPNYDPFIRFFVSQGIGQELTIENQREAFDAVYEKFYCYRGSETRSYGNYIFRMRGCKVPQGNRSRDDEFTISELDEMSRCTQPENPFSWSNYFQELVNATVNKEAYVLVSYIEEIIAFANYFKELPLYRENETKLNERASFLVIDWLMTFSDFLPTQLRDVWSQLLKPHFGKPDRAIERIKMDIPGGCMLLTKQNLQPVIEHMYQQSYGIDAWDALADIVPPVRNASLKSVNRQSWISASAKDMISTIIRSTERTVGSTKLTTDQIKAFYGPTIQAFGQVSPIRNGKRKFGKLLAIAFSAKARANFEVLTGSHVARHVALSSVTLNAFNFTRNKNVFPTALVTPQMYHKSYPDYIKQGSLGFIVGYDLGKRFEKVQEMLDYRGATGYVWDNGTEEQFLRRLKCTRDSYLKLRLLPNGQRQILWRTMSNKDIFDLLAIKAAYGAMQLTKPTWTKLPSMSSKYTPEQLFFIHAAQTWCFKSDPHSLASMFAASLYSHHTARVNGMARNSKEFADAFQCRAGDAMNPPAKCSFW